MANSLPVYLLSVEVRRGDETSGNRRWHPEVAIYVCGSTIAQMKVPRQGGLCYNDGMKESDILWSKRLFAMLTPGGVWGVPCNGLVFQRSKNEYERELALIDMMPWQEGMEISPDDLRVYQEREYLLYKRIFEAAGIKVVKHE